MKEKITVIINSVRYETEKGSLLSQLPPFQHGHSLPCGGRGSCGKCRVRAWGELSAPHKRERELLDRAELDSGVRLACLTRAEGDCTLETEDNSRNARINLDARVPELKSALSFEGYGVAVDMGSTTLATALYSAEGVLLAKEGALNPQGSYGADVISRIEASLSGKRDQIADISLEAIDSLIDSLAKRANVDVGEISSLVITGNTAMLSLLTRTDVSALARAPFKAQRLFGEYISAKALGLRAVREDAQVYLAPCISAFAGADLVCALLGSGMTEKGESALLCDIGTNGEMALWHENKLLVCSAAAGPAFEGALLSCGSFAREGAIDRVSIVNSRLSVHTVGNTKAISICGAGAIDALACLLELGEMDESGYLDEPKVTLEGNVFFTREDVRALQLAKAAIRAGADTLLSHSEVAADRLESLYVCGGFGSSMNVPNAKRIGLLPDIDINRIRVIGNGALTGASMMLLDSQCRVRAQELAKWAHTVSLSGNPDFTRRYIENMGF